MDSYVSPKDEIWFLGACHHISNAVYLDLRVGVTFHCSNSPWGWHPDAERRRSLILVKNLFPQVHLYVDVFSILG